MLLNAIGEEIGYPLLLPSESIVIGGAQQHHVVVASEFPSTSELTNLQLSFSLQGLCDLLWNDFSAEHSREAITDHAFEPALEALHEAHGNPLHTYDSCDHRIWVNGSRHRLVPKLGDPCVKLPCQRVLI